MTTCCFNTLLYRVIPESFRWYISRGKEDKARKVLRRQVIVNKRRFLPATQQLKPAGDTEIDQNGQAINIEFGEHHGRFIRSESELNDRKYTIVDLFRSKYILKTTILLTIVWYVQYCILLNWCKFRLFSCYAPNLTFFSLFHHIYRYFTSLHIVLSLIRCRVTRRLIRLETMWNVLEYCKKNTTAIRNGSGSVPIFFWSNLNSELYESRKTLDYWACPNRNKQTKLTCDESLGLHMCWT